MTVYFENEIENDLEEKKFPYNDEKREQNKKRMISNKGVTIIYIPIFVILYWKSLYATLGGTLIFATLLHVKYCT